MRNSLHNVGAIAAKEIRSLFSSPTAWVLMGLFGFLFGWFFNSYLQFVLQASMQSQFGGAPSPMDINDRMIRPLLTNTSVLVLFLLPMVTMRTYSEEKRSGTIELLLTSPLTDAEIVFGKFLGAMAMYAGLLAVTALYTGILFVYSTPDFWPVVVGFLGLLLMGGCFVAIGLFISSTTKNQMVAGSATFVFLLFVWIINWMADQAGPTLSAVLSYLSITQHFDDFAKGIIDTKHVIFYLSFIAFGLYLTLKSTDAERWRG
jgi:ABC-2 type transport system permease protein